MKEGGSRALHWTLLVGLCLFIHFQGLGDRPLYHEEPRRALVAREMIERGSWIVPTINGAPYLSKPPLFSWLIAGASLAQGGEVTEASARVISSLSVLFTVLLVYGFTSRRIHPRAGLLAGLFTATSALVLEKGWMAEIDMNFTLWVTGAMLFLCAAIGAERQRWFHWPLAYFFLSLAFLAKGPPCLLFFFPPLLLLLFRRDTRERILTPIHLAGPIIFLALAGTWVWLLIDQVGWQNLLETLDREMVNRATPRSFWTWLGQALANPFSFLTCLLPWTIFLLPVLTGNKQEQGDRLVPLILLCSAVGLVLFSLASGRASRYLLPLVPLLSLAEGAGAHRFLAGRVPSAQAAVCRWFLVALCGAIALGSIGLPLAYLAGGLKFQAGGAFWVLVALGLVLGLLGTFRTIRGEHALGLAVLVLAICLFRCGYITYRFPREIEKYSMTRLTNPVQQVVDSRGATLFTVNFERPEFFYYLDRRALAADLATVQERAAQGEPTACLARREGARKLVADAPGRWRRQFSFTHKGRNMVLLTAGK